MDKSADNKTAVVNNYGPSCQVIDLPLDRTNMDILNEWLYSVINTRWLTLFVTTSLLISHVMYNSIAKVLVIVQKSKLRFWSLYPFWDPLSKNVFNKMSVRMPVDKVGEKTTQSIDSHQVASNISNIK